MNLFTFLLAVLLLELTPGPNMAYLATLALSRGRSAGLIATAGVAFRLAVHATVAGLGAGMLIQQYPLLYDYYAGLGSGIFWGPRQQTVRRILAVLLALVAIWLAWATRR